MTRLQQIQGSPVTLCCAYLCIFLAGRPGAHGPQGAQQSMGDELLAAESHIGGVSTCRPAGIFL